MCPSFLLETSETVDHECWYEYNAISGHTAFVVSSFLYE
jgi:hypothetical protein